MSRQLVRTASSLLIASVTSACLNLSMAGHASAKEIVTLICEGSKHITGKAGSRTIRDDQYPWRQLYTLDDNGTFIALTGVQGAIGKGKLTVTSRRYFLDFDSTDPEIKRNGGGLYIDRDTGAFYAVGIKRDGHHEFTFTSTGQCKVDDAPPKF
jgi:hypothetical protein